MRCLGRGWSRLGRNGGQLGGRRRLGWRDDRRRWQRRGLRDRRRVVEARRERWGRVGYWGSSGIAGRRERREMKGRGSGQAFGLMMMMMVVVVVLGSGRTGFRRRDGGRLADWEVGGHRLQ